MRHDMKSNLQKAQEFTLGQCLSDYPPHWTYAQIIEYIEEENQDNADCISVWEPFEYLDIVTIMDNMVSAVTRLLDENVYVVAKG